MAERTLVTAKHVMTYFIARRSITNPHIPDPRDISTIVNEPLSLRSVPAPPGCVLLTAKAALNRHRPRTSKQPSTGVTFSRERTDPFGN